MVSLLSSAPSTTILQVLKCNTALNKSFLHKRLILVIHNVQRLRHTELRYSHMHFFNILPIKTVRKRNIKSFYTIEMISDGKSHWFQIMKFNCYQLSNKVIYLCRKKDGLSSLYIFVIYFLFNDYRFVSIIWLAGKRLYSFNNAMAKVTVSNYQQYMATIGIWNGNLHHYLFQLQVLGTCIVYWHIHMVCICYLLWKD